MLIWMVRVVNLAYYLDRLENWTSEPRWLDQWSMTKRLDLIDEKHIIKIGNRQPNKEELEDMAQTRRLLG